MRIVFLFKEAVSRLDWFNSVVAFLQCFLYYIYFYVQAKLPRGIENIRPHLRSIDNVPLLVNLFTDCNTESKYNLCRIHCVGC